MKRVFAFAPILVFGLLVLPQCGDKTTSPSSAITYLRTDHCGCQGASDKIQDTTDCAFLKTASYDGSRLALTIHFQANCCPAFVSAIKVTGRSVEIALEDTLRGCRCTCAYEDDFVFSCSSPGDLAVKFRMGSETCALDTLISVQQ